MKTSGAFLKFTVMLIDIRCRILLSEFKLQVADSIVDFEKGIESLILKFFKYFFNI